MKVQIDIGLDFEGNHTFKWKPSNAAGAIEIPHSTLERWTQERDSFKLSYLRWKRVIEEIEETVMRADERSQRKVLATVAARQQ